MNEAKLVEGQSVVVQVAQERHAEKMLVWFALFNSSELMSYIVLIVWMSELQIRLKTKIKLPN